MNVMLYIHGGVEEGSGNQPLRPSGHLARKLDLVFVSINYRLNSFGFLALDLLANSNANSSLGNYGLWDVIVAIQWINNNIASFGGDPNKLTIFGPDGDIIMALISNNEYSAFVKNAWILQSKVYYRQSFAKQSKFYRKNFLLKTNCSTVDCLKNMSGREIILIYEMNSRKTANNSLIVYDGKKYFFKYSLPSI